MLGISLEIDDRSVKKTKKDLSGASGGTTSTKRKGGKLDVASSAGIGAALGGFVGGAIGAVVSALKPIQQLLEVVGGILTIFLQPILMLLKPFLVLFLKVGLGLNKWLKGLGIGSVGEGPASQALEPFKLPEAEGLEGFLNDISNFTIGLIGVLGDIVLIIFEIGKEIGQALWDYLIEPILDFGMEIGNWLYDSLIVPIADFITNMLIRWMEIFLSVGKFILTIGIKIWEFILDSLKFIADLGLKIWTFFLEGLKSIADLGVKIWEWFKNSLSSIADLGSRIKDYILSLISKMMGFGGRASGGYVSGNTPYLVGEQGPEIFMPTNSGNIIPNNELSGGGGQTININVTGFVGSEDELADKVSKALNDRSRGGNVNY